MTREPSRRASFGTSPVSYSHADLAVDNELLGHLWEQAVYPRLPNDAPSELRDYLINLEDPRQLYKVHRASRRYGFIALVEKFTVQLQQGCGSPLCSTTSCLTCRQKALGSVPIRRYNPTSARTLAIFLASQDNPERSLCPYLSRPTKATDTVNSISISQSTWYRNRGSTAGKTKAIQPPKRIGPPPISGRASRASSQTHVSPISAEEPTLSIRTQRKHPPQQSSQPHLVITEKPVSKDYRSVSANVFGTVAFRMLEWLTPNSLASLTHKAAAAEQDDITLEEAAAIPLPDSPPGSPRSRSPINMRPLDSPTPSRFPHDRSASESHATSSRMARMHPPNMSRRNSNARVMTTPTSSSKPPLRLSQEAYTSSNDDISANMVSPRVSLPERSLKHNRQSQVTPSRNLSDVVPHSEFLETHMTTPRRSTLTIDATTPIKVAPRTPTARTISITPPTFSEDLDISSSNSTRDAESKNVSDNEDTENPLENMTDDVAILPQCLDHLTLETIDLIYRVMSEDGTAEKHHFRPARKWRDKTPEDFGMRLNRVGRVKSQYSMSMKEEWHDFAMQSIFYCLSNPHALIKSFTRDGALIPSVSLWWGLARLLDSQPTLVFHSLWMAASSLFSVPKSLQSLRSSTTRVFRKSDVSLTNKEAGFVMSICLHALVALLPEVSDKSTLFDISRLRSMGLIVGNHSKATAETFLQYNDAYTDAMALRLAQRLFSALLARQHYAEMAFMGESGDDEDVYQDVLKPLYDQLDQLNMDNRDSTHMERLVTIILDWARTVIVNDWNGEAQFPCNSPFAGALNLFQQLHSKRRELFISDVNLRIELLSDRLDVMEFPVAWLNFQSTPKRKHLLDYSFIFPPSSLVTYFRSINFSRMCHNLEDAASTWEKLRNPVNSTPIPNTYLAEFLQERMKAHTCKYFVLNVSRSNIVKDTFDQLWRRQEKELLRPLKVRLGEEHGEEGFDSGGVQQEFFRLIIAECLDPNYGAFTVDSRTRMAWFVPGSVVEDWKFEMMGLIVSLAVYNGVTLPVTFPKALYRMLLNCPVTDLQHIEDGWPDLANGLSVLLDWDEENGTVEDIFARTYEFSVDMLGEPVSRTMGPETEVWPKAGTKSLVSENPDDAPMVTHENRNAYVTDYIQYLTDISVRAQFQAFKRGFNTLLHPKSLQLLTPVLLQSLVEGVQEIDIAELRRHTRYVGWDASHRTVRDFWSIVKRFDEDMKRKLLEFVTASDRVPVGGMKNIQFSLQKNGEEDGPTPRLPTAYTCYGTMLLPSYKDRASLKARLLMALDNAQGFGFA
ncbi:hypothetical protein TD95_000420 [Thielaviopsis punctulata]|uniref:HECT-type E3 ubiquitin transferase n=1 Tax=Thielaviopsis punctulata TaxID=72032 RepID=A0A0F4ZI99_9PEZI|nr:hypothetical protein TD95_000420 [Thielaviopsis punctulata]